MGTTGEFHELVAAYADEDALAVLESASHSGDGVRLVVSLSTLGRELIGRWEIEAANPVAVLLPIGEDIGLTHHEHEHPLLMPYVAERAHLTFTGKPKGPASEVVGELYAAHAAVAGEYVPLGMYMNTSYGRDPETAHGAAWRGYVSLAGLLEGGYGTLADGPLPLIRAYADVLTRFGISVSVSEPRPAVRRSWHGEWEVGWHPIGTVTLLLLLREPHPNGVQSDPGYVVAQGFTARRRPPPERDF